MVSCSTEEKFTVLIAALKALSWALLRLGELACNSIASASLDVCTSSWRLITASDPASTAKIIAFKECCLHTMPGESQ